MDDYGQTTWLPSSEEVVQVEPIAEKLQEFMDDNYLFPTEVCPWRAEYYDVHLEDSSEINREGFSADAFLKMFPNGKIPHRVRKARTRFLWRQASKICVARKFMYLANSHSVERDALQMPLNTVWSVMAAHIALGTYNAVLLSDQRALVNRKSLLGIPLNIEGRGRTSSRRTLAELLSAHTDPTIEDRLYNEVDSVFAKGEKQYYLRVEGRKMFCKFVILDRALMIAQNVLDETSIAGALVDQWKNVFHHTFDLVDFLIAETQRQTLRVPTWYAATKVLEDENFSFGNVSFLR